MRLHSHHLRTKFLYFASTAGFFYTVVILFVLGALYIAAASSYPMAFDEEFHLGLIKIYASSLLPFGIEHTSDMAQYGAATADASYLFHYLFSFPYRLMDAIGLSDVAIIIVLRIINIGFVVAGLLVLRKAFREAGFGRAVTNVSLAFVTFIPVFPLLAAHINYDNVLFLVIAWCILLLVRLTRAVQEGRALPLQESVFLVVAVLIGMSIKYAFLPLALAMFIWLLWLLVAGYRSHQQTISSQLRAYSLQWKGARAETKRLWIVLVILSTFFASHYLTNILTYGSPIPSCERVFSESECQAYGPWNRNKEYEAAKSESFQPLSFPAYMTKEWFPGMTQRLTFAVAGKTNDFETKLPFPALVSLFVGLSFIGLICTIVQAVRRNVPWFGGLTVLLSAVYVGALSFQLYGDYIDTAEPVAINGRYLLPLLPLVAVVFVHAIRTVLRRVDVRLLSALTFLLLAAALVCGAGATTYIVLADQHWFWNGFGQSSHAVLQPLFERFILPFRY